MSHGYMFLFGNRAYITFKLHSISFVLSVCMLKINKIKMYYMLLFLIHRPMFCENDVSLNA